jgi:hypothetical protein
MEAKLTHEPHAYEKEAKYIILRQLIELKKLIQIICSDSFIAGLKDSSVLSDFEDNIKKYKEMSRLNALAVS